MYTLQEDYCQKYGGEAVHYRLLDFVTDIKIIKRV